MVLVSNFPVHDNCTTDELRTDITTNTGTALAVCTRTGQHPHIAFTVLQYVMSTAAYT